MTWVISDYVAAQGSSELSVQKGQQVEVIDTNCLGAPDYCLVRLTNVPANNNNVSSTSLSSSSTQEQIIQEGLVPSSILKPPPTQTSKSRRAGDGDEGESPRALFYMSHETARELIRASRDVNTWQARHFH
jgi:hypothetical protein